MHETNQAPKLKAKIWRVWCDTTPLYSPSATTNGLCREDCWWLEGVPELMPVPAVSLNSGGKGEGQLLEAAILLVGDRLRLWWVVLFVEDEDVGEFFSQPRHRTLFLVLSKEVFFRTNINFRCTRPDIFVWTVYFKPREPYEGEDCSNDHNIHIRRAIFCRINFQLST